jgi:hypothetical protein
MYRRALLGVIGSLIVAGSASAAPFGELPFTPVTGNAGCLRATGAPGEMVRATDTGVRFMTASAAGFAGAGEVKVDRGPSRCPAVAAQPDGAGVLAISSGFRLQAAVREPGGGSWSPLAVLADNTDSAPVAAVSDRGDAVVAWVRTRGGRRTQTHRVLVARRPAGGTFGAPEVVTTIKTPAGAPPVQVGVSGSGETLVAWSVPPRIDPDSLALDDRPGAIDVAIAGPGGPFALTHRVAPSSQLSAPALAMARDGRALLAAFDGESVRVAERAPGQAFGAAAPVAHAEDVLSIQPEVALASDGAAVVAWAGDVQSSLSAVTRPRDGAFGAPVAITRPRSLHGSDTVLLALLRLFAGAFGATFESLPDDNDVNITATITADGRALITSPGAEGTFGLPVLRVASVPLAGGHVDLQTLAGTLRDPGQNTPVTLADGRTAVAWADNRPGLREGGGRLHLALEGAITPADPLLPTVTTGRPRTTTLRAKDAVELPVRCSAACEIFAYETRSGAFEAFELSKAGTGTLRIGGFLGEKPLAPLHRGPVRIRLLFGGPGAKHPGTKVVTLRLRRPADPQLPQVRELRARRRGGRIEVSWRTDVPAKPGDFSAIGTRTRSLDEVPSALTLGDGDRKRTRFRLTLAATDGVRFVTVVFSTEALRFDRRATVRLK